MSLNSRYLIALFLTLIIIGTATFTLGSSPPLMYLNQTITEPTSKEVFNQADDYSSALPLKANIYQNPSYEDWTEDDDRYFDRIR